MSEPAPIRDVIVHYHIFKNAGTTVDSLLHANFPGTHGNIEGKLPWDTVSSDQLSAYIEANPALHVVSSHQARLPLPEHPQLRVHPVLFLRHPIDRVESVYHFERREPEGSLSPSVHVAKSTDLKGFVEWGLSDEGTAVFRNFQTVFLSGREQDMRFARATRADAIVAKARIGELPCVGIVDRFAESMQAFEQLLKPAFPEIRFEAGNALNRSQERARLLSTRLERIAHALGDRLFDRLLDENGFDLDLYAQGCIRSGF